MLWRADRKEVIGFLENGEWRSYVDTFGGFDPGVSRPGEPVRRLGKVWREHPELRRALGLATAPERPTLGVIQEFDYGTLLSAADRTILVLYGDSSWERYPDAYRSATPTPTPTPTADPRTLRWWASPTAIAGFLPPDQPAFAATPTPTSRTAAPPARSDCALQPVRHLGSVYRENPAVAALLGCVRTDQLSVSVVRQAFERGIMLRRADTREILALLEDGTWLLYRDIWQEEETLPEAGEAPPERRAPEGGFGKLWRQESDLRQALGWATTPVQALAGSIQELSGGRMLWTDDRVVYVLYHYGSWQSFAEKPSTAPALAPEEEPPPAPPL